MADRGGSQSTEEYQDDCSIRESRNGKRSGVMHGNDKHGFASQQQRSLDIQSKEQTTPPHPPSSTPRLAIRKPHH